MPKSLSIAHYPEEFFNVIERVRLRQSVEIVYDAKARAYATRLDFYGFRRALKEMGATSSDEVKRNADLVHVRIEQTAGGVWKCIFHHADDTPVAKAIRDALAALPPLDIPTQPAAAPVLPLSFTTQTSVDDTEDVLARRLRTGPCSECDVSFPCYAPGVKCIRVP